jgi:predicted oxidoreductase
MKPKTSFLASKFSRIIAGTMSWGSGGKGFSGDDRFSLMYCCLDSGISTFDSADIYGGYTNEADYGNAFAESGKIRHFELSNFTPSQLALIVSEIFSHKYQLSEMELLLAWLLKYPANVFPAVGTTRETRLKQSANAINIQLESDDWFELPAATQDHKVPQIEYV